MAFRWSLLRPGTAWQTVVRRGAGDGTPETRRLVRSLQRAYPGSRVVALGADKVRLELPGGDVLRFYVNR